MESHSVPPAVRRCLADLVPQQRAIGALQVLTPQGALGISSQSFPEKQGSGCQVASLGHDDVS
eukprot:727136-Rhodomonas_salina.1